MSQRNVEVMRRGIDAWNRNDRDEWLTVFAPDAEWHTTAASRTGASIADVKRW
jgi:ketosteroid isomerase-like protein